MASYATVDELMDRLPNVTEASRTILEGELDAATAAIDRYCGRIKEAVSADSNGTGFVADTTANTRIYVGQGRAWLRIDECTEITLVEVKDSPSDEDYVEWTSDDWVAATGSPSRPNYNKLPYTLLMVTNWGSESYFTSGAYSGRSGFPRQETTLRGMPTVRVAAKWGYATTTPADIAEAAIMQAIRWWSREKGGMSDTLASGELGAMLFTKRLDPDVAMILRDGGWIRPRL